MPSLIVEIVNCIRCGRGFKERPVSENDTWHVCPDCIKKAEEAKKKKEFYFTGKY